MTSETAGPRTPALRITYTEDDIARLRGEAVTLALTELRDAATRLLTAIEACRAAANGAVREVGAAEAFETGYTPLDVALVEMDAAEAALRAALIDEAVPR